jgi:hypothetical protein
MSVFMSYGFHTRAGHDVSRRRRTRRRRRRRGGERRKNGEPREASRTIEDEVQPKPFY